MISYRQNRPLNQYRFSCIKQVNGLRGTRVLYATLSHQNYDVTIFRVTRINLWFISMSPANLVFRFFISLVVNLQPKNRFGSPCLQFTVLVPPLLKFEQISSHPQLGSKFRRPPTGIACVIYKPDVIYKPYVILFTHF